MSIGIWIGMGVVMAVGFAIAYGLRGAFYVRRETPEERKGQPWISLSIRLFPKDGGDDASSP